MPLRNAFSRKKASARSPTDGIKFKRHTYYETVDCTDRTLSYLNGSASSEQNGNCKMKPSSSMHLEVARMTRGQKLEGASTISGSSSLSKLSRSSDLIIPEKTKAMLDALQHGLKESMRVSKEDLEGTEKTTGGNALKDDASVAAQRYIKRLEMHLAKLDALILKYQLYLSAPEENNNNISMYGSVSERSQSGLGKRGLKDFAKGLLQVEKEAEPLMGTFTIQVKGIDGFARVCPGDQYEVFVRYGPQRWKSRGKMGSQRGEQSWEGSAISFRCLLHEALHIKVCELKTFGSSMLCEKYCDTSGLFSPHPQVMSLRLNRSGSLKLRLTISWKPLPTTSQLQPQNGFATPSPSNRSTQPTSVASIFNSVPQQRPPRPRPKTMYADVSPGTGSQRIPSTSSQQHHVLRLQNGDLPPASDGLKRTASSAGVNGAAETGRKSSSSSQLENQLSRLMAQIDKHSRHYAEQLGDLMDAAKQLRSILKRRRVTGNGHATPIAINNSTSGVTITIGSEKQRSTDSGIRPPSTPPSLSDQIDLCISHHLQHCLTLTEDLSRKGPLKHRLNDALLNLNNETVCLNWIAEVCDQPTNEPPNADIFLQTISASEEVRELWQWAANLNGTDYYIPPRFLLKSLEHRYKSFIVEKYSNLSDAVFEQAISHIQGQGTPGWPIQHITVFQFAQFLQEKHLVTFLESLAHECWIIQKLNTRATGEVMNILDRLSNVPVPPPPECLRHIGMLLACDRPDIRLLAEQYLAPMSGSLRNDLINAYMTFLEHYNPLTRRGACYALSVLKARRAIGALAYLARSDPNALVLAEAKKAVLGFGVEGKEALEKSATDCIRL